MHYTSVSNIMKVIEPLFLNELYEEFEKSKKSENKLKKLLKRLSEIVIFDPACGSGNFLIIAYKELRKLEMKIYQSLPNEMKFSYIPLRNFYGIEIDDFAHEVAALSLWLAEHQMDLAFKEEFGDLKAPLPLKEGGNIVCGNAANLNWINACPNDKNSEIYIIGNPPYLGSKRQSKIQKQDMKDVFHFSSTYKNIDYIGIWFYKVAEYIEGSLAKSAFVTTNSIVQGDQVGLLWPYILEKNVEINFAHTSFKWSNNAKNKAVVTCAIVGLADKKNIKTKYIFSEQHRRKVKNISPYLIDANNIIVTKAKKPLSNVPLMEYGNMPLEGGFLKLQPSEVEDLLTKSPEVKKYIRRLIGGEEFLKGVERYCLWIEDNELNQAVKIREIKKRIDGVKNFRENGGDVARTLVSRSHQFRYRKTANDHLLLIPCTSSENRDYVQCGLFDSSYITLNSAQIIYDPEIYMLAILSSRLHMLWLKTVGGRLKTDYRYSNVLCYNTFPFPNISENQKKDLEKISYELIQIREKFSHRTFASLYDCSKMPEELLDCHKRIDELVESYYENRKLKDDDERLTMLFRRYEELIGDEK